MSDPNKTEGREPVGSSELLGVPVKVWWGLEWVSTVGWPQDEKTITARLVTRTGETKMCRIRNSKRQTLWKHA